MGISTRRTPSVVLPTGKNYRAMGKGQPGICPFDNYQATGIAGIGFFANRQAITGTGILEEI